jgi:hypothetical protein
MGLIVVVGHRSGPPFILGEAFLHLISWSLVAQGPVVFPWYSSVLRILAARDRRRAYAAHSRSVRQRCMQSSRSATSCSRRRLLVEGTWVWGTRHGVRMQGCVLWDPARERRKLRGKKQMASEASGQKYLARVKYRVCWRYEFGKNHYIFSEWVIWWLSWRCP